MLEASLADTYRSDMREPSSPQSDRSFTAWTRLVRVSRSLIESVEADLKTAGMPPLVWHDVLVELSRAGPDGLRPFELQDRILLAQYNLSRLLERIVKVGCAERRPCADDGRGHVLKLTATGQDMLQSMSSAYRAAIARHFAARLDDSEAGDLARLLGKLQGADETLRPESRPDPSSSNPPPETPPAPEPSPIRPGRRLHLASKTSRRVRFLAMKSQS